MPPIRGCCPLDLVLEERQSLPGQCGKAVDNRGEGCPWVRMRCWGRLLRQAQMARVDGGEAQYLGLAVQRSDGKDEIGKVGFSTPKSGFSSQAGEKIGAFPAAVLGATRKMSPAIDKPLTIG